MLQICAFIVLIAIIYKNDQCFVMPRYDLHEVDEAMTAIKEEIFKELYEALSFESNQSELLKDVID